ncbi:MAG: signal recognition particle-docking protein FtsY [Desulfobacterales bacterium]
MIFGKSKKNKADAENGSSELCENRADDGGLQSAAETSGGYFRRLKDQLSKTRKTFSDGLDKIFAAKKRVDDDLLEELEELLITSDIGVQTALTLIEKISSSKITDVDQIKSLLKDEILSILQPPASAPEKSVSSPRVIMVVGVNGTGKTTTIGKLAAKATASGKKVLIAAADTFRAAAIEQLMIWAERANADIVKHKEMADPAAVAFDAVAAASARGADMVFIDTAGRLHTKVNLMEELKKIKRTISKKIPDAPHEVLLVLDATTGQNALSQAQLFNDAIGITALALTKLDGTAKGGIVISICHTLKIPLKYIGIGEKIEDLQKFDATQFVEALF